MCHVSVKSSNQKSHKNKFKQLIFNDGKETMLGTRNYGQLLKWLQNALAYHDAVGNLLDWMSANQSH